MQVKPCSATADLLGAISQRMDAEIMHENQAGTSVSASSCPFLHLDQQHAFSHFTDIGVTAQHCCAVALCVSCHVMSCHVVRMHYHL